MGHYPTLFLFARFWVRSGKGGGVPPLLLLPWTSSPLPTLLKQVPPKGTNPWNSLNIRWNSLGGGIQYLLPTMIEQKGLPHQGHGRHKD